MELTVALEAEAGKKQHRATAHADLKRWLAGDQHSNKYVPRRHARAGVTVRRRREPVVVNCAVRDPAMLDPSHSSRDVALPS
jgi:hypothetical protein